jgi:Family of unknown function (DUF5519)
MNEQLLADLRGLPDVEVAPSQWTGEPAVWLEGREIVHAHGEWIEIRLTSKVINRLDDERAMRRARTSDWVMIDARERDLILELARRAVEANRRPD